MTASHPHSTRGNITLDAAEHYAIDLGWPVFPLAPRSKVPASAHGFNDATTDRERLRSWWSSRPDLGIGVSCTRVVVVDVDVRDGKPGRVNLRELELEHGALPSTWTAATPSGGEHRYFAATATPVRRAIGVRPGIDLLGVGGYVCAPPTRTSEGSYRWIDASAELAELPPWLVALARPIRTTPATTAAPPPGRWGEDLEARAKRAIAYVARMPISIAGQRGHDSAFDVARTLVRGFALPIPIARVVLEEFSARCDPPWSTRELEHKLKCAARSNADEGYLLEGRS